jgi:mannose-6-phosphate isomerase class I
MIDYGDADAEATFARARQEPRILRTSGSSREIGLMNAEVRQFFDATALEVGDEIEVADGRFSIAIITEGEGSIEGNFGSLPIARGDTFAMPASLPFAVRAGPEPVRAVRCMGPSVD